MTTRRPESSRKTSVALRTSAIRATEGLIDLSVRAVRVGMRFRNNLGDLDTLATSIREWGLSEPIGVTPDSRFSVRPPTASGL